MKLAEEKILPVFPAYTTTFYGSPWRLKICRDRLARLRSPPTIPTRKCERNILACRGLFGRLLRIDLIVRPKRGINVMPRLPAAEGRLKSDHVNYRTTYRNSTADGEKEASRWKTPRPRRAFDRQAGREGPSHQESPYGPPKWQDRQDPRPAGPAWRRHLEGTHEGDGLAGSQRPRIHQRHHPQENGEAHRILSARRRGARLPAIKTAVSDIAAGPPLPGGVPHCLSKLAFGQPRRIPTCGLGADPHQHHQVIQPMFSPATQPTHPPVVEP